MPVLCPPPLCVVFIDTCFCAGHPPSGAWSGRCSVWALVPLPCSRTHKHPQSLPLLPWGGDYCAHYHSCRSGAQSCRPPFGDTHTQPCAHQPHFELLLLSWPRSAPYSAGRQKRLTLFLFCHANGHKLPFYLLSLGPKCSTRVRLFKSSYAVNLPFIAHQVKHQLLCVLIWFELKAC